MFPTIFSLFPRRLPSSTITPCPLSARGKAAGRTLQQETAVVRDKKGKKREAANALLAVRKFFNSNERQHIL
jgi:hypothetical protein